MNVLRGGAAKSWETPIGLRCLVGAGGSKFVAIGADGTWRHG